MSLAALLVSLGKDWAWTYTQGIHGLTGLLLRYLPPPA